MLTLYFNWLRPLYRLSLADFKVNQPQKVHFWVCFLIFMGLGSYVGVWAVLISDLTNMLKLDEAALGSALSSMSIAGIVVLFTGSFLADRIGRRPILLMGIAGVGTFMLTLAFINSYLGLLAAMLFGGICASFYDLAVNTIGGDYERYYQVKIMTQLHAGFSGGAAIGALLSAVILATGVKYIFILIGMGLSLMLLAVMAVRLPLPPQNRPTLDQNEQGTTSKGAKIGLSLLLVPVVLLATLLVSMSFLTDGALEGYTGVYLCNLLGSGALLGGVGIAAFYLVGMLGRLASTGVIRRYGERTVITAAGLTALIGMVLALATTSPPLVVGGLLLVGLGQSPIVPTAFSLAARVGAGRGAQAVGLVTAFGYSAFIISPLLIGQVANLLSLHIALMLLLGSSLGITIVARRIPQNK